MFKQFADLYRYFKLSLPDMVHKCVYSNCVYLACIKVSNFVCHTVPLRECCNFLFAAFSSFVFPGSRGREGRHMLQYFGSYM